MPSVVTAVVGAVQTFAAWYAGKTAIVKLAITLGASLAIDAASRKLFGKKLGRSNKDFSRDITVRGAVQSRNIVYGQALVSGPMLYTNVSGTDNKFLWLAVVVAGHEVNAMTDVWLDGTEITNANVNWGSAVSGGQYATYATFHKKLGTTTQTSQTELDAAFTDVTSAHTGKEISYVVGRFELVEESAEGAFQSGPPQNISVLVQGKKVYDPRLDSTHSKYQGGVGTHRVATPSTWSYSDNPALCWADYLIDSRLGPGFATAKIDYDSVADEADYCEGQVQNAAGGSENRFTCNGALYTTDTHRDNLSKILSSMNGRMSYRAGLFVVRAGRMGEGANLITPGTFNAAYSVGAGDAASETSVVTSGFAYHVSYQISNYSSGGIRVAVGGTNGQTASADGWFNEVIEAAGTGVTLNVPSTFVGTVANLEIHLVSIKDIDEDWLAGDVQIKTAPPKSARFNTYHAIIKDPERNYKDSETLEVTQTAYTTRDGETLRREIELPMTNSEIMAQRLLFKRLFATDQQKVVVLRCNYRALQLAPHDFIRVTLAELSWSNKMFRIVSWTFADLGDSGAIDLVLKEDDSAAYAEVEPAQYSARTAAGTVVVGSQGVPSFSNFTATSVFQGILLQATGPSPRSGWTHARLYSSPTSDWASATLVGEADHVADFVDVLPAGTTRYYWLKAFRDAEEGLREPNSDTSTVTAVAGGGNYAQTFYQSAAPSGVGELDGDQWIDSDDNMRYRLIGGVWVEIQDDDIAQAIIDAAVAQAGADTKIQMFYQDAEPSGAGETAGDVWVDTNDGKKFYVYNSGAWVYSPDSDIAAAISNAATAQSTADGKVTTFVQTTAPTAEGVGDMWMDTNDNNSLWRWSGSAWIEFTLTALGADGTTTLTQTAALIGNPTGSSSHGVYGDSVTGYGVWGGTNGSGRGVYAQCTGSGYGLYGYASGVSGHAAYFYNAGGGIAIEADGQVNLNNDVYIGEDLSIDGWVDIDDTTEATSATGTNGSLRTVGGASIAKKLYVGGYAYLGNSSIDNVAIGGATATGNSNLAFKEGAAGSLLANQFQFYGQLSSASSKTTVGIVSEQTPLAASSMTLSWVYPVYINASQYYMYLGTSYT